MNKRSKSSVKEGKSVARDTLDILDASTYGVSPEFLRKHEKIINETKKIISDRLSPNNLSNDSSTRDKVSNVTEYIKVLSSTMNQEERFNTFNIIRNNEQFTNQSGTHSIYENDNGGVIDRLSDSTIIDELVSGVQNHFALMPEYSKLCQIIPELGKCIDIIVKDIINCDEFTHSYITNFYDDNEDSNRKSNVEKTIKNLLDEYDFENKIRKWIKDAEITGAKPFSVLPHDDVINMLNREIAERMGKDFTLESLDVEDLISEESLLVKSPLNKIHDTYTKFKFNMHGIESKDEIRRTEESINKSIDSFTDSILTPDIIDEWSEICTESMKEAYEEEKINLIDSTRSNKKYEKLCNSFEEFESKINDPKYLMSRESCIKDQLKDLVVCIDRCIEVVDPMKAPLYQASKKLKNVPYGNESSNIDKGIIKDFYRTTDGNEVSGYGKKAKKAKKTFTLDGFDIDVGDEFIDKDKYAKLVNNRRGILTEYEPEHVIPVSSGGTHIGYYVIEYERTNSDNFLLLKKDKGSFLDIIRRLGVSEDKALAANSGTTTVDSSNPFTSGAFSPATVLSPVLTGTSAGPLSPYNGQMSNSARSDRKAELIKTIMIKTISKRLGDKTLADNGTFQSSLMNLIRDDLMFRNRVRFTYIPESHMVYMSRELDSNGFPLSVLDGTLFMCYSYVASLISSLLMKVMKSSDTEVMEVNVGKSKELGLTIGSISQNASTRNVSSRTLFGGTDNIVRHIPNFKRIIIPVVNGEKLYDVTQLEKTNNIEIDDEFTERLIKSIIMKIGVPPTSLDMLDQDEYVASMTQHRMDYRNLIIDRGVNYSKYITKGIKLLVYYSDINIPTLENNKNKSVKNKDKSFDDSEVEIDISKINFQFASPKNLTVNKIYEEIRNISELVEEVLKMYFGEDERDGEEWKVLKIVTRKMLMREFSSSTDWSRVEELIEKSRSEAPKTYADLAKHNIPAKDEGEEEGGTRW